MHISNKQRKKSWTNEEKCYTWTNKEFPTTKTRGGFYFFFFILTLIDMKNKSKRGALVVFCLQFLFFPLHGSSSHCHNWKYRGAHEFLSTWITMYTLKNIYRGLWKKVAYVWSSHMSSPPRSQILSSQGLNPLVTFGHSLSMFVHVENNSMFVKNRVFSLLVIFCFFLCLFNIWLISFFYVLQT